MKPPLCSGQVLWGSRGLYKLHISLKNQTVYKAKVLSSKTIRSPWVMVKTASTANERMCLKREYCNHRIKEIAACTHIRGLCDTIQFNDDIEDDPSCLVFEWMDHDLRGITAPEFRSESKFPKAVSKAVLSALSVLRGLNAVHTDISPNNIYISNIHSPSPIAKLGDLGNAIKDSSTTQRLQPLTCRAPEVWQGIPCTHASDLWSLAVTLTTLLSPLTLFGSGDKIIDDHEEAWCIAKIIRLVGPLLPVPQHLTHRHQQTYAEEVELAQQLATMDHPVGGIKLITRNHWREELEYIPDPPVPSDVLDFIESLLVMDHEIRPTAEEALMHPYLQG